MERLSSKTFIPASIDAVWDFFSTPLNLAKITPKDLALIVRHPDRLPEKMYQGMIIVYTVSPFPGIKNEWVTEITHCKDKAFFVDEQRFGPYSFWHHQHLFKEVPGGVEMEDIIHYKVPLGALGRLFASNFVKGKLNYIFTYRADKIEHFFPGSKLEFIRSD